MAWECNYFCGYEVESGDKPIDEISLALKRVKFEYIERFGRKPSVAELLYAFDIAINSSGDDLLSDPESLHNMILELKVKNDS